MSDDCPIPVDLNVQQFWRDHNVVTDEMAAWLKKQAGCQPYEGLMDVPASRHVALFKEDIPDNMVAWMKVDRREGALNVFKNQVFYTGINGRGLWVRGDNDGINYVVVD